jgi:LuxR family transcriptional regulator, maltose regulon positive regulatory protein
MEKSISITQTKILVPRRRSDLLSRQRLLDTLYELLDKKLIIIAAPAGYGKTSLVIDFAHHTEWPFCWYSLDLLDREPQRFLAHLITTIMMQFPGFGHRSRTVLQNMSQGELNLDSMVSVMVNDAFENITEHFVLVLDDYHLLDECEPIAYFLSRFIQEIDDNCHVMLLSRKLISMPDLPLMVARNQAGGLSMEELAFLPQEIQNLLLQYNHRAISDAQARELARTSEGWITGLLLSSQMAENGIADRLRMGKVSNVGLYEYLATQVLLRQPSNVQEFLLRTSLLGEMEPKFCQEVIGKALNIECDWAELVNTVFLNNLFVLPVGEDQIWLRYHNLFQDFLQVRMTRERPEETEKILARLAEVYLYNSEWERTYELYYRMGRTSAIVKLLETIGAEMIASGRLITLAEWLEGLSNEWLNTNPTLLSLYGSVLMMRGEPRRGLEILNKSVEGLQNEDHRELLGRTLVRRSTVYRHLGDYTAAILDAEKAMEVAGGSVRASALRMKGVAFMFLGRLKEALEYLDLSLAEYKKENDLHNAAIVQMEIGLAYTNGGNYLSAEAVYSSALNYWQQSQNSTWLANVFNNLGDLQRQMGEYENAIASLEKAIEYARASGYLTMEAYSLASIGDLYRDLEACDQALEAYNRSRVLASRIQDRYLMIYINLGEAALASSQGKIFQARSLLEEASKLAESSGSAVERNLCRFESGRANVLTAAFDTAIPVLEEAAAYFLAEGRSLDALRARVYLMIARFETQDEIKAKAEFQSIFVSLPGQDFRAAFMVSMRDARPYLEQMRMAPELTLAVDDLLRELDLFDHSVAVVRRQLRRRSNVIPFAPPKLQIHALGKIQVLINDHLVAGAEWQTQVARDLFFFLLARQEGITKEAVGEVFWTDCSPAELKLRFKNTIYRLRHAVGKDVIVFSEEIYQFNTALDYEYDVESFFREVYHAERATEARQKISFYQAALKNYQGPYLPGLDDTWVMVERQKIHSEYFKVLLNLGKLLLEAGDNEGALNCCQRALGEDPTMEDMHRLAMRIYAAMGNQAAIVRQYEFLRQILQEELNTTPSSNTRSLYEMLIH